MVMWTLAFHEGSFQVESHHIEHDPVTFGSLDVVGDIDKRRVTVWIVGRCYVNPAICWNDDGYRFVGYGRNGYVEAGMVLVRIRKKVSCLQTDRLL